VDKEDEKSLTIKGVVEDVRGKTGRTLSLLWHKWKPAIAKDVLH
jgi:hypothetical protein